MQVSGPDADRLIDLLTCRDLTQCAVKQCKYMLVTSPDGGIVNDPVLVHPEENVWWMQLADSDAGLYALGVRSQLDLDAEVTYPDVHPVQVQGPLSGRTLEKLVGEGIYDIKYYWCDHFEIGDIPVVITRTGWSAVPGFEVNLLDGSRGDDLWDAIMGAGEEFDIRPIAPERGAPRRGRHLQLGLRHHARRHAVPRHGAGAAGRGAAAGLHRQGRAGAGPRRRASTASWSASSSTTREPLPGISRKWDGQPRRAAASAR